MPPSVMLHACLATCTGRQATTFSDNTMAPVDDLLLPFGEKYAPLHRPLPVVVRHESAIQRQEGLLRQTKRGWVVVVVETFELALSHGEELFVEDERRAFLDGSEERLVDRGCVGNGVVLEILDLLIINLEKEARRLAKQRKREKLQVRLNVILEKISKLEEMMLPGAHLLLKELRLDIVELCSMKMSEDE